ncbi:MAG: ATP-binding cassette domain-containing protein [Ignavibacteriaceae bacterium]
MLSFDSVYFSFGDDQIFEDLNFELKSGEFCFLIGKSGAGKSTLIQLIYMNLFPQSGFIRVGDYCSNKIKSGDLPHLRRKLGIVFQDFRLLKDRNVYRNLEFVLEVTGTPRKEVKRKINNALTDVGLSHKRYSMPHELSGGEQQRLAIARAVVNEPFLILADEPTGNLDPETSREILEILKKINSKGTAVLFATHNYELVKENEARIIKLENGKAFNAVIRQN